MINKCVLLVDGISRSISEMMKLLGIVTLCGAENTLRDTQYVAEYDPSFSLLVPRSKVFEFLTSNSSDGFIKPRRTQQSGGHKKWKLKPAFSLFFGV